MHVSLMSVCALMQVLVCVSAQLHKFMSEVHRAQICIHLWIRNETVLELAEEHLVKVAECPKA